MLLAPSRQQSREAGRAGGMRCSCAVSMALPRPPGCSPAACLLPPSLRRQNKPAFSGLQGYCCFFSFTALSTDRLHCVCLSSTFLLSLIRLALYGTDNIQGLPNEAGAQQKVVPVSEEARLGGCMHHHDARKSSSLGGFSNTFSSPIGKHRN